MTLKTRLADRRQTFALARPGKAITFAMPAIPAMPALPAVPATPFVPDMDMPVSIVVVHSSARMSSRAPR